MQGIIAIVFLIISNIFMTFAWYGHLRFRSAPLWEVILISWLIAFLEYCFQVPANRIGSYQFSAAQLKVIQEVITLVVFGGFSVLYLKEQFRWNYLLAFAFIVGAVISVFAGGGGTGDKASTKLNDPSTKVVADCSRVDQTATTRVGKDEIVSY